MKDLMKTAKQATYEVYRNNPNFINQDVLHDAYVAMLESVNTWNPDKGSSLHSWAALIVRCSLYDQIRKSTSFEDISYNEIQENVDLQSCDPCTMNPELLMIINETFASFSDTSKEIIRAIFEEKIKPETYNKNAVTREIKNYLRGEGFPWWKIQAAFKELRQYANNLA